MIVTLSTGLITPLGIGTDRVWENLVQGKCGITKIHREGNILFVVLFIT